MPAESSSWSEPEAVTTNAEGRLTPAQRSEIIGPPVAAPRVGLAVLVVGLIGAALLGLLGVGGIVLGAAAAVGVSLGTGSWRLRDRLRRRRAARLTAARIRSDVGLVFAHPGGWSGVTTAEMAIALPDNAPKRPPPGRYLLYWVDLGATAPGRLLSAEPLGQDVPVRRHDHHRRCG